MTAPTPLGAIAGFLPPLPPELAALPVSGIALDSRRVRPGFLFAALPPAARPGAAVAAALDDRGRAHIADAVRRGAGAVLAPPDTAWPEGVARVPLIEVARPRAVLARLAAAHAGPQPPTIAAVTGTNGKTSTVEFLRQLWDGTGVPAASLGTLGLRAAITLPEAPPALTTPDSVSLAAVLAGLAAGGIGAVALEASSHGLDQFRLDGVRITAAGFSNLSQDHLDYHGTLAAYRDAKLRLFEELLPATGIAAANADMDRETLARLRGLCLGRGIALRTAGENGRTLQLLRATPLPHGQVLELSVLGRSPVAVETTLPGRYQADNVMLATLLAAPAEEDLAVLLPRLGSLSGVRGRMELAARLPNGACSFVDYAHTPDAIERLLASLRPHVAPGGRLLAVIGAGGDRDRTKRAPMGAAAARGAELCFVTDDNPRTENPALIRADVMAGCPGGIEVPDRRRAIADALAALRPGDVLVVAGKGHEQGQIVGDTVLPFDDAAVIRELAGTLPPATADAPA
ncbi:MAG: UDP-N-acetylmuramoyl-L-alanyl-D-glutamate--2,6-diaminopimelate ligase [Gluconacetobacter diazotrophicus]|nr:UDP-N-acetylmuramoyl-L-alanyl-D-glutamate--2,6-diaminopimelate ligase [Gluconacetobacter diazotrophicus]